ncbi:hypothetical protein LJY25_04870 [Hymenobacter sp. BT175]|uniref:hypothetical protein n=1 Tax=Hymenobacter translucens TaxID=2886507 RepID=UPI001D0DEA86|nr:hypothetical protein [Hymenobacter translucens]MCC2545769.1 hypothetical protein [Hymenobacter translucens]
MAAIANSSQTPGASHRSRRKRSYKKRTHNKIRTLKEKLSGLGVKAFLVLLVLALLASIVMIAISSMPAESTPS